MGPSVLVLQHYAGKLADGSTPVKRKDDLLPYLSSTRSAAISTSPPWRRLIVRFE